MSWTALLLAGSRPGTDPFASAHGTDLKPLIPAAGAPMVARPARALLACEGTDRLLVLSQAPERIAAVLPDDPRIAFAPSRESIAATIEALCADPQTRFPLLVTTADHALLTSAMIEQFAADASSADLAIGLVAEVDLLARLPGSRRTWIGFRGGRYSGANLFWLGSRDVICAVRLWRSVEQDRKKGWRLLFAFGPAVLLGAVLKLRTLDQTLAALGRRLGIAVRAVRMADPLAAVDVDKEADLQLAERLIAGDS
ncbi:4-diphosphocytidyl-2C-methyl-D-erythritol synthase [Sphingomonas ginkgonis]|uniref:4-diphosphocytidyl-2C-methyl-D-erythritol synthase n=1 Tax=Sphingomonas ginkgonis TaxID=2315330 RepID=A0A3R9Y4N1_9SPHN|nr:NTP transferase domain-containing protein [Sphingomonas ginkgonis]RST30082.1 4-diphosphocytidyl-2C-methyl-D-erythritol synthase [Sphingomonas ginkgonis]